MSLINGIPHDDPHLIEKDIFFAMVVSITAPSTAPRG
jgi:hypothetical protein